jgi:hypothetical protein
MKTLTLAIRIVYSVLTVLTCVAIVMIVQFAQHYADVPTITRTDYSWAVEKAEMRAFNVGAQLYVAPNGSGTECTFDTPCSFGEASGVTKPGDTVLMRGGTYRMDEPITFKPYNNEHVTVDVVGMDFKRAEP